MAYKHKCGCGNHGGGCQCTPSIVDIDCLTEVPWDDAQFLLGYDGCSKVIGVEKPPYDLTDKDREKLDSIIIDGDGNSFLSDDGAYKEVYTKEQSDELFVHNGTNQSVGITSVDRMSLSSINGVEVIGGTGSLTTTLLVDGSGVTINGKALLTESDIENVVRYDQYNDIRPTRNVILKNNTKILGTTLDGRELNLAEYSQYTDAEGYPIADYGSTNGHVNLSSANRPTVQLKGETGAQSHEIAFLSDVAEATGDITELTGRVAANEEAITGLQGDVSTLGSRVDNVESDVSSIDDRVTLAEDDIETLQGNVSNLESNQNAYHEEYVQNKEVTDGRLDDLEARTTQNEEDIVENATAISDHVEEYNQFRTTVNETFVTVNTELSNHQDQITENTQNISINADDIAAIRQDIVDLEKFRGYFDTTNQITSIPDPTNGDYAWNAETGTVWTYNGVTWADSGDPIPDQTVQPSTITPIRDQGTGETGTSNTYARADHIHPEDTTKANVTDLDNYLPLAGNSQTTPMTGDIWLGTNNDIFLSDSGNSYITLDQPTATLEMRGNGAGGIDLTSDLGTIKANGQRIIVNGENSPNIQLTVPNNAGIQLNAPSDAGSVGLSMLAGSYQVSGGSALFNITGSAGFNVNSADGNITLNPTVGKLFYGSSDIELNEVAKLSDIEQSNASIEQVANDLEDLTTVVDGKVSKAGDTMAGKLEMTNGADIQLDYNSTDPSAIYGVDDDGISYNLIGIRTYAPSTSTEIDQVEAGSIAAQFNANSLYVPTVDNPTGTTVARLNEIMSYDLSATPNKSRIVLDRWLKANYYDMESVDSKIGAIDLTPYLNLETGGNITGDTYYKGSELVTANDLLNYYNRSEVQTLLSGKANTGDVYSRSDADALFATKTELSNVNDNLQEQIDNIDTDPVIAASDMILTFDAAGLKGHIDITSDGNEIIVTGKINEETGEPYEIATFNIVQNQIVDRAFVQDNILHIVFIVDGGEQEVQVDLSQFITAYLGSTYINVDESTNIISLNYNELKDSLVNDGFVDDITDVQDQLTNVVKLTGDQTINGTKTFSDNLIAQKAMQVGIIGTSENSGTGGSIRNTGDAYLYSNTTPTLNFVCRQDLLPVSISKIQNIKGLYIKADDGIYIGNQLNTSKVATIGDLPTDYVDLSSDQVITGKKTILNNLIVANTTDLGTGVTMTYDGNLILRRGTSNNTYGIEFAQTGSTTNNPVIRRNGISSQLAIQAQQGVLLNGVNMATVDDIPTDYVNLSSNQTINGVKTFISSIYSDGAIFSAGKKSTSDGKSGCSLGEGILHLQSDTTKAGVYFYDTNSTNPTSSIIENSTGLINVTSQNGLTWNNVQIATVNDIVASRLSPVRQSATGETSVEIGEDKTIISVNYNRFMLFESDYTYVDGVVTVTNTAIDSSIDENDKLEVVFF